MAHRAQAQGEGAPPRETTSRPRRSAVVVDTEPLWIEAFVAVLEPIGFSVVGRESSLASALRRVEQLRPELLVAGIVPSEEPDWAVLIEQACAQAPGIAVVVIVDRDDQHLLAAASRAGAAAVVLKRADPRDLTTAIRQAFEQTIFFGPQGPCDLEDGIAGEPLSGRELEVLRLISDGHRNIEVARALWISQQTVKTHLAHIYRKLGVGNRTEASQWYHEHVRPNAGRASSLGAAEQR